MEENWGIVLIEKVVTEMGALVPILLLDYISMPFSLSDSIYTRQHSVTNYH